MSKKTKEVMLVLTIIVFLISMFFGDLIYKESLGLYKEIKNFNKVQIPTEDSLSSIILFKIDGNLSQERTTISDESDIKTIIKVLNNSKKEDKESVADLPDKREFTMLAFEHRVSEGYSISSIYKEDNSIYFEQAYHGIFKLKSNDLSILDQVIESGEKENKLTTTHDIFMGDF